MTSPNAAPSVYCYGHCGYLGWTVTEYGRVTHKRMCPHRTEPWCQEHPQGCPDGDEPLLWIEWRNRELPSTALHRDQVRLDWPRQSVLMERYPADDLRCMDHRYDRRCSHSYVDHSAPHTMEDCPYRDRDAIPMVSVGPGEQ